MIIQWFPGHMTKTQKMIIENRDIVDVFLEVVDARAPLSCRNPLLDKLIGEKARVIILNKTDLADPAVTDAWKRHFDAKPDTRAVLVSSKERQNVSRIVPECRDLIESLGRKKPIMTRAMIVGIPNVGKSTLINALVGQNKVSVAPKPGHTRSVQRIRLADDFELLDSPGILWHKFEDMEVGKRLAMIGAIKDDVYDFYSVTLETIRFLAERHPDAVSARYRLDAIPEGAEATLEEIGRKRGCVLKGALIDLERAAGIVMNDFRSGALGRLSLERPEA